MRALLRWLFPHYRELEECVREEASRVVDMQDRLNKLQEQNLELERAVTAARSEQVLALKSVANVGFHLSGLLPPYPEAYQIPRQAMSAAAGPVPTGRTFPRDVVQQAKRDFHNQLYGLEAAEEG